MIVIEFANEADYIAEKDRYANLVSEYHTPVFDDVELIITLEDKSA